MICIVNTGAPTPEDGQDTFGLRTYELRINNDVLCTFQHKRSDGLGTCLRRAATAFEQQRERRITELLDLFDPL